jgi:hypothetical protein
MTFRNIQLTPSSLSHDDELAEVYETLIKRPIT